MNMREYYNALLRELLEWYDGEKEFLINALMPDGLALGEVPRSAKEEWAELSVRSDEEWAMRGTQNPRKRNEEYTRYLHMRGKFGAQ
jgi:hypothetical protein